MGDSCAELCSGSALFVFNGVDIVCGVALTVYSLYLGASAAVLRTKTRSITCVRFAQASTTMHPNGSMVLPQLCGGMQPRPRPRALMLFCGMDTAGPILAVGVVLILTGLMSWCGAANQSCSCCLSLSSYLLIVLALAELALGIAIFTQGTTIDKFLRDHQQELHLTCVHLKTVLDEIWMLIRSTYCPFQRRAAPQV